MGSESFVETVKEKLGYPAKGWKVVADDDEFQLREERVSYIVGFGGEKANIGCSNSYLFD